MSIASVDGLVGNPGSSYYAATRFAVAGLSDALSTEVRPLGIKVTVVEPGPFRTDWAGRSLRTGRQRIDAYATCVHERLDQVNELSGKQTGEPVRAAEAMITAVDSPEPPLNLVLGAPGLKMAREKLAQLQAAFDRWEKLTLGADYPAGQ